MAAARRAEPWDVVYCLADDESAPADEFLDGCPPKVSAQLVAVLDDVAEAPPPRYAGGGHWEATHGSVGGYYAWETTIEASFRVASGSGRSTLTAAPRRAGTSGPSAPGRDQSPA
jgi:hypothetical protein